MAGTFVSLNLLVHKTNMHIQIVLLKEEGGGKSATQEQWVEIFTLV